MPFRRLYPPAAATNGRALWFVFQGEQVVLREGAPVALHEGDHGAPECAPVTDAILIGEVDGHPLLAGALAADAAIPAGCAVAGLRSLFAIGDEQISTLAGCAAQLLRWRRTMRYCPVCAAPLRAIDGSWGRSCSACEFSAYPPVSPAIIVLIHDDAGRALLTTKPGWGKRYSLVAGFVEPGETFEECVVREVAEEVGVAVDTVRYVGSQAWPFPHQIMVGFMARYAGGTIAIDEAELAGAAWFSRDDLPELPPPFTISRRIIELWRGANTDTGI